MYYFPHKIHSFSQYRGQMRQFSDFVWCCSGPLQVVGLHSKRLMAGMKRAKKGLLTHLGPCADCLLSQLSPT